tara:strand:+ start:10829 stop:12115 length:1287 start_codon:yes stop_codon:yes gene_type:complete
VLSKLKKQFMGNFVLKLILSLLGIINTVFIAYIMTGEDAGYLFFSINAVSLLAIVLRMGLDLPITRDIGTAKGRSFKFIIIDNCFTIIVSIFALGALASTLFYLLTLFLSVSLEIRLLQQSLVFAVFVGVTVTLGYVYIGMGYSKLAQFSHGGYTAITLFLGLVVLFSIKGVVDFKSALFVYYIAIVSALLFSLYPIYSKKRFIRAPKSFNAALVRKAVSSFWLPRILFTSFSYLPVILIGLIGSNEHAAVYAVIAKVTLAITMVNETVVNFFTAKIAKAFNSGNLNLSQSHSKTVSTLNIALTIPICILLIFLALYGLDVLGAIYNEGFIPLTILLLCYALSLSFGPVRILLTMGHQEKVLLYSALMSFSLFISLALGLYPLIGLLGVAIAQGMAILASAMFCAYRIYCVQKFWALPSFRLILKLVL